MRLGLTQRRALHDTLCNAAISVVGIVGRAHLACRGGCPTSLGDARKQANMRARLTCLLLAVAMMAAPSIRAGAADQTLMLAVGQQAAIELEENPSTGYRWAVDAAASSNLSILHIGDRGFSQEAGGKHLLGAPGIHRWSIEATSAGSASVSFVYRRPWEATFARKHQVTIEAR
jgi:inhibitor of cysteine peptidase